MRATRREILWLAAWAASRDARAQAAGERLVVNAAGIRMAPFGDQSVPALTVWLPGIEVPAVVVEMPEHAWHKRTKAGDPEWFYRRYTNDQHMQAIAEWTRDGDTLAYRMTVPSGFALNATASLDDDGVTIAYEVRNPESQAYAEVQAITCIKLYRPFTDIFFLERTYVHHSDGLDLLASETPQRLRENAEEWLPCRYIARCPGATGPVPKPMERRSDGITYYYKQRLTDASFLATESFPRGWVAATHALSSPDVWTNPARTCQHADSGTPLDANGSARLSVKLYLVRGSVQDAWTRIAARERSHQI
jgi:hypothetical protein